MTKKFINNCETCQKNKVCKHIKEHQNIATTPSTSFEILSVDRVGPFRISDENPETRYI